MKKSKIVLVLALAVVLAVVGVSANTFSWFTRTDKGVKGSLLSWNTRNSYIANSSSDSITVKTYKDVNDDESYSLQVAGSEMTDTLQAGSIVRYKTEITNNSESTAQSVSLYAPSVSIPQNGSSLYLGVNNPSRTHRNLYANVDATSTDSGTKTQSTINQQNVYVGLCSEQYSGSINLTQHFNKIHAWGSGVESDAEWYPKVINVVDTENTQYWKISGFENSSDKEYKMLACTIDYNCTEMQFWYSDLTNKSYYVLGSDVTISNNNIIFFYNNGAYKTYAAKYGDCAGIKTFYSAASISAGNTIDLAGEGKGTITYSSSDTSVATVDASTGVVSALSEGTATITMTSTGTYGDTITAECNLIVSAPNNTSIIDVPIVTNVNISAQTENSTENTVYVYWYVQNSSSYPQKYTVNGLTVTK